MQDNVSAGHGAVPGSVYWVLALGLFSFSASPILVRLAGDAPSLSLVVLRTLFSIALLAPFAIVREGRALFRFSRKELIRIGIAGVLLGVHFYVFFEAIRLTTVASATVFVSLSPIFLGILGYLFLGERLSRPVRIGIGVAIIGGCMIAFGDADADSKAVNPNLGNFLALSACLMVSIYLIIGRVARQRLSWLAYVFPLYLVACLTVLLAALVTGTPLLGLSAEVYGLCVVMAIFPQILGHGSFNYAIKFFPAAILGLLALTEPIGSTILAYMLFDEMPSLLSFAGMAVTLSAVTLALLPGLLARRRRSLRNAP